ncbi:Serine O-succinyltransferase [Geodia barretti]|uniref:Serine O-succinyltransferase n=1 Tax=Geodia barretti TaxID=519541 RepID=A0AA35WDT7_GEOBA|nr:Serine O-succinyltransferase [Geodia barretti]
MSFPVVTVEDMVAAQFLLLDHLGISRLHAAVGSSLGGMQSIMAAALCPDRVNRVISISACLRTHPSSIAMRYVQRQILMGDPDWNEGNYYDISFPRMGMTHAREVGLRVAYRREVGQSGQRFGKHETKMIRSASPTSARTSLMIEALPSQTGERNSAEGIRPRILYYIYQRLGYCLI